MAFKMPFSSLVPIIARESPTFPITRCFPYSENNTPAYRCFIDPSRQKQISQTPPQNKPSISMTSAKKTQNQCKDPSSYCSAHNLNNSSELKCKDTVDVGLCIKTCPNSCRVFRQPGFWGARTQLWKILGLRAVAQVTGTKRQGRVSAPDPSLSFGACHLRYHPQA